MFRRFCQPLAFGSLLVALVAAPAPLPGRIVPTIPELPTENGREEKDAGPGGPAVRVYRFALMGPFSASGAAVAAITEVSDDCWTSREFGFVTVHLLEMQPTAEVRRGMALWNELTGRFDVLVLER